MTTYYLACTDFAQIGAAIKKIKFIKEINEDFIMGHSEIIWTHGNYDIVNVSPSPFRLNMLEKSLDDAIDKMYKKIDQMMTIVENRKTETLENVKLAEEILKAEKQTAIEAAKAYKKTTNTFKNLDIRRMLEKRGISG